VVDVHATVADLWSSPVETDGISLVRPRGAQHEYVLCGDVGEVCARSANKKLRRVLATGAEQFYDLILDPFENQNRIAEPAYAAEVAAHRAWLDARLP
jgi:hypothetical protein